MAYTKTQVQQALIATQGRITAAADAIGCAPNTVRNYIERYSDIAQLVQDCRERRLDRAESKLDDAIDRGEAWAIALILKTQGKERGYVERTESEQRGEVRIVVEYADDSPDAA